MQCAIAIHLVWKSHYFKKGMNIRNIQAWKTSLFAKSQQNYYFSFSLILHFRVICFVSYHKYTCWMNICLNINFRIINNFGFNRIKRDQLPTSPNQWHTHNFWAVSGNSSGFDFLYKIFINNHTICFSGFLHCHLSLSTYFFAGQFSNMFPWLVMQVYTNNLVIDRTVKMSNCQNNVKCFICTVKAGLSFRLLQLMYYALKKKKIIKYYYYYYVKTVGAEEL